LSFLNWFTSFNHLFFADVTFPDTADGSFVDYRGLPVFERLVENPANAAIIKTTLTAEGSAAPRGDPRFVIRVTVALESHANNSQASRRSSGKFVHLRITTDGPDF
jgi:hypothetical protein